MKKAIRIIIPIALVLAIIICTGWYLFVYDREFTRDMLLYAARSFEYNGNHTVAAWFYDQAYLQANDNEAVAIELADQYKASGNYTKAEYTLSNAIADGGGIDLYIALCKTYVEQDKLLDAVDMLNHITNTEIKEEIEKLRPAAPTCSPDPSSTGSYYTQYITVKVTAEQGTLYVNPDGQFPSVGKDVYKNDITLTDGENVLYAIAVDENGLVSPVAIFPFTVGGVVEEVKFSDSALEKAIREKLKVTADKLLYTSDLWTIKDFTVPEEAKNLEVLQHLVFLEQLTVKNAQADQIAHISGLSNLKNLTITGASVSAEDMKKIGHLPNLEVLNLSSCSISTVAGLEAAKNLVKLDLSDNAIRNIEPLRELTKLQELNLSHNALNDLSALFQLTALTKLDVSYNNLTTLTPITAITGLKELSASNNTIASITDLQKLTALTYLDLSENAITDIAALSSCVELSQLNISGNKLTDISILSGLTKLVTLNFSKNEVKKLPAFTKDCALVNIDGSYNQLNTLEPLKGLTHLNNVFMDYNKDISSLKALTSCPVLIQVNVYGTKVTKTSQVKDLTDQSIVVNYTPSR